MKDQLINVIFLVPSDGKKALIVLRDFLQFFAYKNKYSVSCIVYSTKGKLINFLKQNDIPYISLRNEIDLESTLINLMQTNNRNVLVSCSWPKKVPTNIINMDDVVAINCHSSYLPDYKGASPFLHQWANLEKYGGATIHYMGKEFDTGDILCQDIFEISYRDMPYDVLLKSSRLTSKLLVDALEMVEKNEKGMANIGGRYFLKTSKINFCVHRVVNLILNIFSNRRWLTKWK